MIPIHCDLGEGEPLATTRALMRGIDACHIACGGHAGDDASIASCLELARAEGVEVGAHPGIADRADFGRRFPPGFGPTNLDALLDSQVGPFLDLARKCGVEVRHLKLHGALYHAVDHDPQLGRAFLARMARSWPRLVIVARSGGFTSIAAAEFGLAIRREAFLDRGYRADGNLVPRDQAGALVDDPDRIVDRLQGLIERGGWSAVDGTFVPLSADALCIHGDSPAALRIAERLREIRTGTPAPGLGSSFQAKL